MIRDIPSMLPDAPEAHVADAILGQLDQYLVRTLRSQRLRLALIGKSVAEQRAEFGNLRRRGRARDFSISGPPVHLAVAAAGIEVIRFRQTHGELPASLEEVARDGLELDDFYMEKPFAYTQDGNSFTVYSAGADQKDDGGSGRADVVFRACFPHR